ncbi:MAG: alpha/beta hydrolase [Clostridia bacterium]|nr:alpha/beta hydrolase [Clostridia bacterium]
MVGIKGHKILGYIKRHFIAKFDRGRKKRLTNVFEYRDVVYTIDSNNKHKFDIYVPAAAGDKVFPIMLYVHGGKYITGDKLERTKICKKLASLGIVVFNINYSLVPKFNLAKIETDLVLAMEEAMNIAVLHNGDYNQVYLAGDEVGAGLVMRVVSNIMHGVYAEYLADYIVGTLAIAGRYDLSRMKYRVKSTESKIVDCLIDELHNPEDYDADKYIDAYYPETIVVCGKQDEYLDETEAFVELLNKNGVRHTFINSDIKWAHTQKALVDKKDTTIFNDMASAIKKMNKEVHSWINANLEEETKEASNVENQLKSKDSNVDFDVEKPKTTKKAKTTKTSSTTKKSSAKKSATKKTTTKKTTKVSDKKPADKKPATKKTTKSTSTAKKTSTKKTTAKK